MPLGRLACRTYSVLRDCPRVHYKYVLVLINGMKTFMQSTILFCSLVKNEPFHTKHNIFYVSTTYDSSLSRNLYLGYFGLRNTR
jgi:hypothetical protein